jgi:hypothetical protein
LIVVRRTVVTAIILIKTRFRNTNDARHRFKTPVKIKA